jgi:glycerate kinase
MAADLAALARSTPSLRVTAAPKSVTIGSRQAIKATYETVSDANPVTGKTVTLVVDRYAIAHAGKLATIDMATPRGVDNVDAYRLMVGSLKWMR